MGMLRSPRHVLVLASLFLAPACTGTIFDSDPDSHPNGDGTTTTDAAGAGRSDAAAGTDGARTGDGGVATRDASVPASDGSVATRDGSVPASDGSVLAPQGVGLFEQPHSWTKNVASLPKAIRSDSIIGTLSALGGWGGGGTFQVDFSIVLLDGDATTPRRTVTAASEYCYDGPDCEAVPIQVPIPTNGNTEGSSSYACDPSKNDCHVLVVERSSKKLYELYGANGSANAFTASGVYLWDLTRQYPDTLRGDQCTSADAAGLPISALLVTADEVASGAVEHAVRFILPNPRMKAGVYVRPATHAGAPSSTNADAPPYGVRFRLKSTFDESPFNAGERTVLRALKTYGMILSDGGEIPLTFAADRLSTAKWASLGVEPSSFASIGVDDFEVVDLTAEIALTFRCKRNP
jgi:hypothetical protein